MSGQTIEERVKHYFLAMGAEATAIPELPEKPDLALSLDGAPIYVVVLKERWAAERSLILDSIMRAAGLTGLGAKVYVAMPKILAATVDGKLFLDRGLGLITYDHRRMEESIQARETHPPRVAASIQIPEQLLREVEQLKSSYASLAQVVEGLRVELGRLQALTSTPREPEMRVEARPMPALGAEGLPSYFSNNPWLDVLSKRGKEFDRLAA